jgi:hypothetical protein
MQCKAMQCSHIDGQGKPWAGGASPHASGDETVIHGAVAVALPLRTCAPVHDAQDVVGEFITGVERVTHGATPDPTGWIGLYPISRAARLDSSQATDPAGARVFVHGTLLDSSQATDPAGARVFVHGTLLDSSQATDSAGARVFVHGTLLPLACSLPPKTLTAIVTCPISSACGTVHKPVRRVSIRHSRRRLSRRRFVSWSGPVRLLLLYSWLTRTDRNAA